MAHKQLIVCDNCGKEHNCTKHGYSRFIKIMYEKTVAVVAINNCVADVEMVKKDFDFCCDDCAKSYIWENGFKESNK